MSEISTWTNITITFFNNELPNFHLFYGTTTTQHQLFSFKTVPQKGKAIWLYSYSCDKIIHTAEQKLVQIPAAYSPTDNLITHFLFIITQEVFAQSCSCVTSGFVHKMRPCSHSSLFPLACF